VPRNIEIKAKVDDVDILLTRVEQIADRGPEIVHQEDIFFSSDDGRLKLRRFSNASGELIFYQRPDGKAPSESKYFRSPTTDPDGLSKVLSMSLGVRGVVKKTRTLYWSGQTRVHIDEVEGLGSFMELEVVLEPHQTTKEGTQIANDIMKALNIKESVLVEVAYIDLLEERTQELKNSRTQE
jgi:predicted adenylyl cyclase CyaB